MKIAIALFGDEVSPRFDCCTGLRFVSDDGSEENLDLRGQTATARMSEVLKRHPSQLLCGGIRRCDLFLLLESGIQVIEGLCGDASVALDACKRGELKLSASRDPSWVPPCRRRRE